MCEPTTGTSVAQSGLGQGNWDYRIRACAGFGCSAYSGEKRTLVELPPAMPASLSSPSTDMDGSYTVSWSAVTGALRYELQESTLSGNTWGSWTTYNVTGTSRAFIKPDGNYRYRVRACKTVACSDWKGPVYTEVGTGWGCLNSEGEPQRLSEPTATDSGENPDSSTSLMTAPTSDGSAHALAGPGC